MDLTRKPHRKLWLKVHLYLGLFAGAVFVLIGLTGSLLAFEYPLDEWLNADLMTVNGNQLQNNPVSVDAIVESGLKAIPAMGKPLSLDFPRHSGLAFALWFEQPAVDANTLERHQIFINPYTARVTGQRLLIDFDRIWRDPFKDFILRLHYSLGLAYTGMTLVGFIGLGLLFSVLSGLILWWPSSGKFSKALTFKRNSSAERFNFDLHKTFGFYPSFLLIILILTGVYLIFPNYGRGLISVFSPVAEPWPSYQSTISKENGAPLRFSQVIAITDARCPDGEYSRIDFPQNDRDVYLVNKRTLDEPNQRHPQRRLWIDQYSGKIIHVQDRSTRTPGDTFVEWLYPLHTGEAFGIAGQLIIMLMGFVPLVLYVTGIKRWLQKRRAANVRTADKL